MEVIERRFYRRNEVAQMLGVSERTVDRKIRSGRLRAVKMDHLVLIDATSVTEENILSVKPIFENNL